MLCSACTPVTNAPECLHLAQTECIDHLHVKGACLNKAMGPIKVFLYRMHPTVVRHYWADSMLHASLLADTAACVMSS